MSLTTTIVGTRNTPSASGTFPGENGKIAFQAEGLGSFDIMAMNQDGTGLVNLSSNPAFEDHPAWSPDGKKIAFVSSRDYLSSNTEIYVMNADGANQTRLTHLGLADPPPAWSSDGSKIAFVGREGLYVMDANGRNQRLLVKENFAQMSPAWSPDGSKIAFVSIRDAGQYEIYVMNADGANQTRLTHTTGYVSDPSWSPDGSKIAFGAGNGTVSTISTINADGTGLTTLHSSKSVGGIGDPVWSPDGSKIAFEGPDFSTIYSGTGIYVMDIHNGRGDNVVQIAHSGFNPDWGVKSPLLPPPPFAQKHNLLIHSTDKSGKPIEGLWATISKTNANTSGDGVNSKQNATVLKSGYTPFAFTGDSGTSYIVSVADYDGMTFSHWQQDYNSSNTRTVNLTANAAMTAVYDTGDSVMGFTPLTLSGNSLQPNPAIATYHPPTVTVKAFLTNEGSDRINNNSSSANGGLNKELHMWTIIDPNLSKPLLPTTFKVYATDGYQNLIFDHWEDGKTDRVRTLTIAKSSTITAYYRDAAIP